MSSFGGDARSSAFSVKDKEAFFKWAEDMEIEVDEHDEGRFSIWREDYGLPFHEEFLKTLAGHLAEGSVAVMMRAGWDCSGYPEASAVAVNWKGKSVRVDLEDIYEKAAARGGTFEKL